VSPWGRAEFAGGVVGPLEGGALGGGVATVPTLQAVINAASANAGRVAAR
jgi:hypothetical protein